MNKLDYKVLTALIIVLNSMKEYLVIGYNALLSRASLNIFDSDTIRQNFEDPLKEKNLSILYKGNGVDEVIKELNSFVRK